MYLSLLILNSRNQVALRALSDLHAMHRLIWQAFPHREEGGAGRVLYRVESAPEKGLTRVLVQSDLEPCWDAVQPTGAVMKVQQKPYAPVFTTGQMLRFRLRANPTVIQTFGEDQPHPGRRRIGLYKEDEQRAWLTGEWRGTEGRPAWLQNEERISKTRQGGFTIQEMRVDDLGVWSGRKPDGTRIQFLCVDYNGVLKVLGPNLFLHGLENGIGSGKGFGFGLLSVAPG